MAKGLKPPQKIRQKTGQKPAPSSLIMREDSLLINREPSGRQQFASIKYLGKKLLATKENLRYAPQFWDYATSHNATALPCNSNGTHSTHGYDETLAQSKRPLLPKTKLCAFLYSNWHCVTRNRFYEVLSQHWRVDALGRVYHNRPIQHWRFAEGWRDAAIDLLRPYRFAVSFENSQAPHYMSEKLIYALRAGCVPIYWGAPKIANYINPACFINAHDFESLESLAQYAVRVANDTALYQRYATAPIFAKPQQHYKQEAEATRKQFTQHTDADVRAQASLPVAQKLVFNRELFSRLGTQGIVAGGREVFAASNFGGNLARYRRGLWPFA